MIQAAASKYWLNRAAMITLSPFLTEQDCSCLMVYRDLLDEDVIGLSSMDDSSTEGQKKLSWIWKVEGSGASANEATEEGMLLFYLFRLWRFTGGKSLSLALRIEWCRARARVHHWQEECLLLAEEMRCILAYFVWRANWWKDHAINAQIMRPPSSSLPALVHEMEWQKTIPTVLGKWVYALRQADIQLKMAQKCQNL